MKTHLAFLLLSILSMASAQEPAPPAPPRTTVLIVVGAGGTPEFAATFRQWAANWQKAAAAGDAAARTIGLGEEAPQSLAQLRQALAQEPKDGPNELWLVLLGHGDADPKEARFNLAGDDLKAGELATLLKPFSRPLVLINTFSSSGAFLAPLSAPGRVILSATKGGAERNFSRLGGFLSESINDPAADLDKDGQTSLLEAWLAAVKKTAAFYRGEGRILTEHSLLEDNGDGKGTPADWFRGVRAVKTAQDGSPADGLRAGQACLVRNPRERALSAEQRARRDALEMELAQLRAGKAAQNEDEYFRALEAILLQIAAIYAEPNAHP